MPSRSLLVAGVVGLFASLALTTSAAYADSAPTTTSLESTAEWPGHHVALAARGVAGLEVEHNSGFGGARLSLQLLAIPDWLVVEAAASLLTGPDTLAVPVELLLLKPFSIVRGLDLLAGLGPEIAWRRVAGTSDVSFGIRAVVQLIYWPHPRFGLTLGPTFDAWIHDGLQEYQLGGSAGVIVGLY